MYQKKIISLPDTTDIYLANALMDLMEKKPLEEISITELTKKAGVSRMSYYRSFSSKQQILEQYLQSIVEMFREKGEQEGYLGKGHGYLQLLYSFQFFRQYNRFALCLHHNSLSSILLDGLNRYMENYLLPPRADFLIRSHFYAFAGALYNLYIQWLLDGMKQKEETMAEIAYRFLSLCFKWSDASKK